GGRAAALAYARLLRGRRRFGDALAALDMAAATSASDETAAKPLAPALIERAELLLLKESTREAARAAELAAQGLACARSPAERAWARRAEARIALARGDPAG